MSAMHKRKSSKEDPSDDPVMEQNDQSVPTEPSSPVPTPSIPPSPPRSRVHSAPHTHPPLGPGIPARGKSNILPPLVTGIPSRRPPSVSLNSPPTSPFHTSFVTHNPSAHSRTRSISSGPFVPPISSPLATSFPARVQLHAFPSSGAPEVNVSDSDTRIPPGHTRRHSRLHSRNLSIFFPRPQATISEDVRPIDEEAPDPHPDPVLIPGSQSEPGLGPGAQAGREFNAGFTFGGLPKSNSEPEGIRPLTTSLTTRRGHHHKHSVSHNFFSFLEPGQSQTFTMPSKAENLHTTPAPTPMSPWSPISNDSLFAPPSATGELMPRSQSKSPAASRTSSVSPSPSATLAAPNENVSSTGMAAGITAGAQFVLGALLWGRGQSIGSLACTGLGYWVVFDAVGVAGPVIIARQLKGKGMGMYGPARGGATLLFTQCVYLMFAGVYVAKEAIEHLLLSASGGAHGHGHGHSGGSPAGDGHHHHWGDENPETLGLRFPVLLILLVLLSLIATSAVFGQHEVLVSITNKHIPSPFSLFQPGYQAQQQDRATGLRRVFRNPYALPPILFCIAILGAEMILDVVHYAPFDLALAAVEVIVTAHVAFAACVVLGGVLLQTSPPMKSSGVNNGVAMSPAIGPAGKMEAFWRVVREIERHEHVVHLPAPHVWQVMPAGQPRSAEGNISQIPINGHTYSNGHNHYHGHIQDSREHDRVQTTSPALIITLSPHVRPSLPDADVLALTQWASSRVLGAFGKRGSSKDNELGEVEVTVGVVRA